MINLAVIRIVTVPFAKLRDYLKDIYNF